jgi:glycosyltransferase involved in cell wall biosynthesis
MKVNRKINFRDKIKRLSYKKPLKIAIKIATPTKKTAHNWGDYHFALSLKKEFEKDNYEATIIFKSDWDKNDNADVVLVLRGLSKYKPKTDQFNIMWNISHPDMISTEEYNEYDYVLIASDIWADKLKNKLNVPIESLLQCTDPELFYSEPSEEYKHELLFVGNSRNIFRKIIKDLLPTERNLGLYGKLWNQFVPKKCISGEHISNSELHKSYSSCKILLNDHWKDMAEKGFISNRIFDGFASGAFIISDEIKGARKIFGNSLVTYTNSHELNDLINYYIENEHERIQKIKKARKIVLKDHTFQKRSERIIEIIASYSNSKNGILKTYKNKSLKSKLLSKFPSAYILFNKNNKNIKTTLITVKGFKAIEKNHLFDFDYYLRNNLDVKLSGVNPLLHYIYHGYKEGRNPNPNFDGQYYLKKYKDVKESNLNPLVHYSLYGLKEKRKIREKARKKFVHNFKDFEGFLAQGMLSPVVYAPFREEDKRCFATMENISKYLRDNTIDLKDFPLVSIIMPVYNRTKTVLKAINSVLNQTYPNIELIIVDDGSNDGTSELLRKLQKKNIILLYNDKCQGVSKARNRALKSSKGKYISYLDSDNEWDPKYLETMIGAFLELPDADALYSGQLLFKKEGDEPFAIRFGSFNKSLLKNRNYIDLNCFCHTREVYQDLGGFNEEINRYVDWDLIIRISERLKIYSVPVLLSHYYFDKSDNTITTKYISHSNYNKLRKNQNQLVAKINEEKLKNKNSLKKKVSIIIPNYDSIQYIKKCIESLLLLNLKEVEIIVIDNTSNPEVINYLKNLVLDEKIKLIENENITQFAHSISKGLKICNPGSDILILKSNAILTPYSLESLQTAMYTIKKCGLVIPQQVVPSGTKSISMHVPFAKYTYECDINLSIIHNNMINVPIFHSGDLLELQFASLFSAYIKRDIMNNFDLMNNENYLEHVFCDYIRNILNLKIYHVSEAIVYNSKPKT